MAYNIPSKQFSIEETIRKSRFIATCDHITTAEEAKNFHYAIKTIHKTASHNCFAYVAGPSGSQNQNGISDDGEPKGTAGYPMLNTLLHSDIGEVAVVVTRYYGGVKLGTGGLVRAYSGMVKKLLNVLPVKLKITGIRFKLLLEYKNLSIVQIITASIEGEILSEAFTDKVSLTVLIPDYRVTEFKDRLPFDVEITTTE